mgnify:CR=1 FL=1
MTKQQKIISVAVFCAIIALGYYFFTRKSPQIEDTNVVQDNTASTTNTDNTGVISVTSSSTSKGNEGKVTIIPIVETKAVSIPVPDLSRKVVFAQNIALSDEAKKIVEDRIIALQTELKKDKTNLSAWLDLGLYQKTAGDYIGAAISWKYVSDVADRDYISFGNLGDLYGYYLHDNGMAEAYYKKAIANGPNQAYIYIQLAMFYRDVFKDLDMAKATIEQGLVKLPDDPSLLETKKNLAI